MRLIVTSIGWAFTSLVIGQKRKAPLDLPGPYKQGMPASHYTAVLFFCLI